MLLTSRSMDSATAVKGPTEPFIHSLHRQQQYNFLSAFVLHIEGCTSEATNYTKIGALCSYFVGQAVQKGHSCS